MVIANYGALRNTTVVIYEQLQVIWSSTFVIPLSEFTIASMLYVTKYTTLCVLRYLTYVICFGETKKIYLIKKNILVENI